MQSDPPTSTKTILNDRFVILKHISEGGTAKVKLAFDLQTNLRVAIKILNNLKKESKQLLITEVEAANAVQHPNLLRCIEYGQGSLKKPNGQVKSVLYMALELAQKETLFDFVIQIPGKPLPESIAVQFFEQFVLGLNALHVKGICHRDIKCENIFLSSDFVLKIADFGYAAPIRGKQYKNGQNPVKGVLKTKLGTTGQLAPEIIEIDLANPELPKGYFGQQVDIFNAGIILFNMIFQQMPFINAVATDQFYKYVMLDQANNFWSTHQQNGVDIDKISPECKNLIFALIQHQPDIRPTLLEILSHNWITQCQRMPLDQIPGHFQERKEFKLEQEKKERALLKAKKAYQTEIVSMNSHRGVDENGVELPPRQLIPFDDGVDLLSVKCSAIDKNVVFEQIQVIFKEMNIEIVISKTKFKMKFQQNVEESGIYACIYFMESQENVENDFVIIFQKLDGEQNLFMKFVEEFKYKFLN